MSARLFNVRKWIIGLAMAAMLFSGIAAAGPSALAAGKPFDDIVSGNWSEKHILKLSMQGIIAGTGNGKFQPTKPVKREDAVIIAIKFMGLADQVDPEEGITFPSNLQVDDYAKGY